MVPSSCCGAQERDAHEANLKDIGRRYADILTLEECIAAIEGDKTSWETEAGRVGDGEIESDR